MRQWTHTFFCSTNNSFVRDGKLYILPTLTSDSVGDAAILDGYTLNLTSAGTCTSANTSDYYCAAASNASTGTVIPPVQSARINTKIRGKSIRYGKVEITARMPTGDWIWPAVWMMPVHNAYGPWPASGEIDIFEGKGNPSRKRGDGLSARGSSTLHYGAFIFSEKCVLLFCADTFLLHQVLCQHLINMQKQADTLTLHVNFGISRCIPLACNGPLTESLPGTKLERQRSSQWISLARLIYGQGLTSPTVSQMEQS